MSKAIDDVIAERNAHRTREGFTDIRDDQYTDESLAAAAACYAQPEDTRQMVARYAPGASIGHYVPALWPESWGGSWWKTDGRRRRDLVKAAALLIAEIERLDRASETVEAEHGI